MPSLLLKKLYYNQPLKPHRACADWDKKWGEVYALDLKGLDN